MTERPDVAGEETLDDSTSRTADGGGGTGQAVKAGGDTVVQVGALTGGSNSKKPAMGRGRQTTSRRRRSAAAKASVEEASNEPKPQIPKPARKDESDDLMAAFDRHELPTDGAKATPKADQVKADPDGAPVKKAAPAKTKTTSAKTTAKVSPAKAESSTAAAKQKAKPTPASTTSATRSTPKSNPMAMQSPVPSAKVSAPSPAAPPAARPPAPASPVAPVASAATAEPKPAGLAAAAAAASATRPSTVGSRRTRKARLRLARIDPWSVMKTVFLFSVAFGIMGWVAVYALWQIMAVSGLFDAINSSVMGVISSPNNTEGWRIEDYFSANKVLGFAAFVGVVNAIITTALGTLGAFLYNLSANILGGLELTLAED